MPARTLLRVVLDRHHPRRGPAVPAPNTRCTPQASRHHCSRCRPRDAAGSGATPTPIRSASWCSIFTGDPRAISASDLLRYGLRSATRLSTATTTIRTRRPPRRAGSRQASSGRRRPALPPGRFRHGPKHSDPADCGKSLTLGRSPKPRTATAPTPRTECLQDPRRGPSHSGPANCCNGAHSGEHEHHDQKDRYIAHGERP